MPADMFSLIITYTGCVSAGTFSLVSPYIGCVSADMFLLVGQHIGCIADVSTNALADALVGFITIPKDNIVTVAMLDGSNNNLSLHWELEFIITQNLRK